MKKLISGLLNGKHGEAIRYLIAGGLTTLLSLMSFAVLCSAFGVDPETPDSAYVTIANVISIILAILFAYVVNKRFVFRSSCSSVKELALELIKFVGARLFTMAVEVGGVYLFVNILRQYPIVGKIETQVIVIVGNYLISKFLVFEKK